MNKRILIVLLLFLLSFNCASEAQFRAPRIIPIKGQTPEQEARDVKVSSELAIEKTGIDPGQLKEEREELVGEYTRYSMAIPDRSRDRESSYRLYDHPMRRKADDLKREIRKINSKYRKYLKAFSEEMEARGYKVK